ncbi:hypothetical protein VSQ48_07430 [Candidatus Ventrimonas sp. KK005]
MFFEKSEKIFRGFFKRRKPQKGGLGVATPTRFPQDKIERLAKFGTVVESCSKKVAASSVWAFADTLDGEGGASASLCGDISSPNTYNTTQNKNDGDLRKFLHFLFIPYTTKNLKTTKQGRGISLYPPLHGIILAIFENAKNGRKKTGNLFLISCLGVPFYVTAVIRFSVCYNSTNLNLQFIFACFLTLTSDVNTLLSSTSFGFPNLAAFTISTSPKFLTVLFPLLPRSYKKFLRFLLLHFV